MPSSRPQRLRSTLLRNSWRTILPRSIYVDWPNVNVLGIFKRPATCGTAASTREAPDNVQSICPVVPGIPAWDRTEIRMTAHLTPYQRAVGRASSVDLGWAQVFPECRYRPDRACQARVLQIGTGQARTAWLRRYQTRRAGTLGSGRWNHQTAARRGFAIAARAAYSDVRRLA